ncbi:hypothetical protein CKM354_000123400 [Cercospora kikuchii]|uniref:Major facilitator superfamily (MFS) profile domain-containing protein n=1 Tax=Cercospora kikuchii TaxID=84275 RepID=A0A9P3FCS0_9PEZI|nr:uncharacterized protein CKM354_000123400 [Cercospora kikuchii]GIZ37800.1 hypothetical protein CKM354_000123400 [Cercospora kikuchii]
MSPISQNVTQPATGDLTPYLPSTHEKKDDDSDSRSASRIEHAIDESPTVVDAATEKALMRKLDMRLVPMVMWMYLMSFMDRVSIGNARLYGMEADLGLTGNQYQIGISVLFITYCLFEAPSNMVLKQLRPKWYLAALTLAWGLVATFSAFTQNFAGLIAIRLLLGLFEAGLFPGLIVYLTIFYNKRHIALRMAYLFATAAIAGAVGGLVSYGIGFMDNDPNPVNVNPGDPEYVTPPGTAGWRAWRWIFAINGALTVVTAFAIPFVLADKPENAKFLTEQDRCNMVLLREAEVGQTKSGQEFAMKDAKEAFVDWKVYVMAACQFCSNTTLYAFSVFLPTIINQTGSYSIAEVQCLTIPIYALGAGLYIGCSFWSDKIQIRGPFIVAFTIGTILGYLLLITYANPAAALVGCFFVGGCIFLTCGMAMPWFTSNNPRFGKRTTANGIQLTVGNAAGVLSPFLFTGSGPVYTEGYAVAIGLLGLSGSLFTGMHFYWRKRNANKRAGKEDWRAEGLSADEVKELGDKNPNYFFTI